MLYIGCPMWGYKEWVGSLFPPRTPQGEFLRLYSRRLTCVEGNTTFYAVPSSETVLRWRSETPETFRFCFKLPRSISHAPELAAELSEMRTFLTRMSPLGERLGPLFLQLPPSFGPTHLPQLETLLNAWPAEMRLAVEVRHPAFFEEPHAQTLNDLLRQRRVGRVMLDSRPIRQGTAKEQELLHARERKPDLPVHPVTTTDFAFLRYIGHPQMEKNFALFDEWAAQLAAWQKQGLTLYVFCHCPDESHSPAICAALYERVRALAPLPALPWQPGAESPPPGPEQGRLF